MIWMKGGLVKHFMNAILRRQEEAGAVPDSTGRAECRLHVEDDRLPR